MGAEYALCYFNNVFLSVVSFQVEFSCIFEGGKSRQ